jgi:site-specific DNA-methyltransferase (adenine-specific)
MPKYREEIIGDCRLILGDCLEIMPTLGKVDLAIVDPPYGIDASNMSLGDGGGLYRQPKKYKRGNWDKKPPPPEYFKMLSEISTNQIIWGANHFISLNPKDSSCWIVWDKNNGGSDFADCELAWTSFDSPVRIFKFTWSGFIQGNMKNKEEKIHPTQKPAELYKWILNNYANKGEVVLDTHGGSFSSAVACMEFGYKFIGIEKDKNYFDEACKRIDQANRQGKLFAPPKPNPEQLKL